MHAISRITDICGNIKLLIYFLNPIEFRFLFVQLKLTLFVSLKLNLLSRCSLFSIVEVPRSSCRYSNHFLLKNSSFDVSWKWKSVNLLFFQFSFNLCEKILCFPFWVSFGDPVSMKRWFLLSPTLLKSRYCKWSITEFSKKLKLCEKWFSKDSYKLK